MGAVFRARTAMEAQGRRQADEAALVGDENQLQRSHAKRQHTLKVASPHAVKVLDFGVRRTREYYMVPSTSTAAPCSASST